MKKLTAVLLTLCLLLGLLPVGVLADAVTLLEDNEIAESTAGHYYVNMPTEGTSTLTITAQDIDEGKGTFKVYDDGGSTGEYRKNCKGTLVLTAPEGYVLRLTGTVQTEKWNTIPDYLQVHDGNSTSASTLGGDSEGRFYSTEISNEAVDIGTLTSSGTQMTLYFHSDSGDNYDGLDLTVTLVKVILYSIGISSDENGSVSATVDGLEATSAMEGKIVTLSAAPDPGYVLSGIVVKDASQNEVNVSAVTWYTGYTDITFTMPESDVTVTPTFTAANGLYINMPVSGTTNASIPASVASFNVYDDGGLAGNYSDDCNGTLVLTAPECYRLQLTGTVTTENVDYLCVYDVGSTGATEVGNFYSSSNGTTVDIGKHLTSGNQMELYFHSYRGNYAGLNLTVTLVPITYTVAFNANDGTGTMDPQSFNYNEAKNLTDNSFERTGYTFSGWNTVADGTGDSYTDKESVSNLASTQGAAVNLYAQWTPTEYTITYNNMDDATNAGSNPATYTIETATINLADPTKDGYAFGGWYSDVDCTGNAVTTIASGSTGNVSLYAKWTKLYTVTVAETDNGTVTPDKPTATEGETVTLTVTPEEGYELETLTVKKGEIEVPTTAGENNTYTFTMPAGDVTVTATFKLTLDAQVFCHTLTLEGQIGVNTYLILSKTITDDKDYYQVEYWNGETMVASQKVSEVTPVNKKLDNVTKNVYGFTVTTVAKEMDTVFTMKIKNLHTGEYITFATGAGKPVLSVDYAVTTYLTEAQNSDSDKLKNLAGSMANFGTYAKHYFAVLNDNSTDALPTVDDFTTVNAATLENWEYQRPSDISNFTYKYTTLLLEKETTFRMYFTSDSVASLTIKNGDTQLDIKSGKGMYYVEIPNIAAKNLDVKYTLTISNGTTTTKGVFSPLGYAYAALKTENVSDSLKYLVSALYYYNQNAKAYFTNN